MYHLYHDNTYQRPGIPPGAGNHPATMAQRAGLPPRRRTATRASIGHGVAGINTALCAGGWRIDTTGPSGWLDDNPAPVRYSKLKLKRALSDMGLWSQVKAAIRPRTREMG